MTTRTWLCLAASAALCGALSAAAEPRPKVVELFTSEGCSSCPPAETYLGELARRSDVLALAYHVQYWDDLGWQDRYGLRIAAHRQDAYVTALHLPSAYTPQVILDGAKDLAGSDRAAIGRALAIQSADAFNAASVRITLHDAQARVTIADAVGARTDDVVLVAFRRRAVTNIGRGENAGRVVTEFNMVRAVLPLGRWDGKSVVFNASLSQLPVDATDIAVLVQGSNQGPIIGAASVALPAGR